MSGVEVGATGSAEGQGIGDLLMINRELALETAQERADRVVFSFRRTKVFERTFRRELKSVNALIGFTDVAEGGFVPVGYHDPHAELTTQSSQGQL